MPNPLAVASLLATSGCSKETTMPDPTRTTLASEQQAKSPEELRASIREATKYRDPREGLKPKGIDMLSGEVKSKGDKDATDEVL